MTVRRSATESGIPLYLIPHAIARRINKQSENEYRIGVKRILWHYDDVTARTNSLERELRPGRARELPSRHEPADNRDGICCDGDSGGAP